MPRWCFSVLLLMMMASAAMAQRPNMRQKAEPPKPPVPELTIPELISMQDWESFRIDTTMKKKGYLLMQKDVDSMSGLYQYSHLERVPNGPAIVRAFSYMDVEANDRKGRLIRYRTYSREEYRNLSGYLLANNYTTSNTFDFKDSKHTIYSNGTQTIRVITLNLKAGDGRKFTAYELELGK